MSSETSAPASSSADKKFSDKALDWAKDKSVPNWFVSLMAIYIVLVIFFDVRLFNLKLEAPKQNFENRNLLVTKAGAIGAYGQCDSQVGAESRPNDGCGLSEGFVSPVATSLDQVKRALAEQRHHAAQKSGFLNARGEGPQYYQSPREVSDYYAAVGSDPERFASGKPEDNLMMLIGK